MADEMDENVFSRGKLGYLHYCLWSLFSDQLKMKE